MGDGVQELSIKIERSIRVLLWRLDGATLVLHVRESVGESSVQAQAGIVHLVLDRICRTMHRMRRLGTAAGPAFSADSVEGTSSTLA